jgi:hypothetical protein
VPRDIDSLEYVGSASDICRAYASIATLDRQPGLSPVTVLAENPSQPLGDNAIPAIVSAVKAAFTLAARG